MIIASILLPYQKMKLIYPSSHMNLRNEHKATMFIMKTIYLETETSMLKE